MRKLILLALAAGTYEYLRRQAERDGTTPSAVFGQKISDMIAWLRGDAPAPVAGE
jgi:hypothetical protein